MNRLVKLFGDIHKKGARELTLIGLRILSATRAGKE